MKLLGISSAGQVPMDMHGIRFSRESVLLLQVAICVGAPMEPHAFRTRASRDGGQQRFPKSQMWRARQHGMMCLCSSPNRHLSPSGSLFAESGCLEEELYCSGGCAFVAKRVVQQATPR